jgi:hypothetical protein
VAGTDVRCPQCGGSLEPDEGQIFLTCPFCASAVFLDKTRVVFHWVLRPTLDEAAARAALHRWMAGNETVKDLDRKASVTSIEFAYFPLWLVESDGRNRLEPAAATSVSELRHLKLPAGDLIPYSEDLDPTSVAPTVPLEAMLTWTSTAEGPGSPPRRISLVHVPLFSFHYTFGDRPYLAVVEGVSGRAFANLFPAKAEAPYRTVALAVLLVFLALAALPVAGALVDPDAGPLIGSLLCLGLGGVAAPVLFAGAAWVASRV